MAAKPLFSIIIPFGQESVYIDECVRHCLNQSFKNFEVIVLPDNQWIAKACLKKGRVFPTGKIGPAEKRDIGAKKAKGKFLAFIDDDAFPEKDWLLNAKKAIEDSEAKAVCGPAVLVADSFIQKSAALFYSTRTGSGSLTFRYAPESERFVDDYPSSNLIIEKKLFLKLGGFDSKYYPGEDTVLCQKIIESGGKIFYSPKIVVNHYPRTSFSKHFKQVFQYGLHRGFFVKKSLKNSLKPQFFAPLGFFVILIVVLALAVSIPNYWLVLLGLLAIYYILVFVTANASIVLRLFAPFLFFMTHISYGIGFTAGLLVEKLER